ncbi:hypothetical protein DFH09DRAFT_138323 [Mycena vulgaris]|nr:hypothetical protein DFH09DRAFT_138323 [Mycena vulgaris]
MHRVVLAPRLGSHPCLVQCKNIKPLTITKRRVSPVPPPAESAAPPSLPESKGTTFGKTTTTFTPRMRGPSSPHPCLLLDPSVDVPIVPRVRCASHTSTASCAFAVRSPSPCVHPRRRTSSPRSPSHFLSFSPPRSQFRAATAPTSQLPFRRSSRPGFSPCVPRHLHRPLRPHRRPGPRAQARAPASRPCFPRCPSARMCPPTSPVTNERNTTTSRSRRSPRPPLGPPPLHPSLPPSTLRGSAPRSSTPIGEWLLRNTTGSKLRTSRGRRRLGISDLILIASDSLLFRPCPSRFLFPDLGRTSRSGHRIATLIL